MTGKDETTSPLGRSTFAASVEQLALDIEDVLDAGAGRQETEPLDAQLAAQLAQTLDGFARSVTGCASSSERGCLVVNPRSFSQQIGTCPIPPPSISDVPAMGFAWLGTDAQSPIPPVQRKGWFAKRKPPAPPMAGENVLRNEFFEVRFDPHSGAIRAISDYHSRGPRLAQQIALRLPHGGQPGDDINYSIMAADELTVTSAGPVLGEIQSRGRLLDREGRRVAGFRQTTRARRGSRIIELEIELDIERQPGPNPWDSYYAARFAWKDETSVLHRDANLTNLPTELMQFESPHFVDICRDKQHTTLLPGGLPYHRRLGLRKLDTLLVVQGETARTFRIGIGIDLPHPLSAALGFLAPPLILPDQPSPPTPCGWLFHLDCRNVLATHWRPLFGADSPGAMPGAMSHACVGMSGTHDNRVRGDGPKATGFRVRLLETDARSVSLGFRCFRAVASARTFNYGDPPTELAVEGDRINIPIGPHQRIEVDVRFASP